MTKVMIVEDEPLVRVGLRSIIDTSESGFTVCAEANNGAEAFKLLSERHPDVILLDIKMPNMDGIEFLKEKKGFGDITPVIVLSCHGEYEYVREAMKLGARDYILKLSAKPQDLLSMLEQIRNEKGTLGGNDSSTAKSTEMEDMLRNVCICGIACERLYEAAVAGNLSISPDANYVVDMLIDRRNESVADLFSDRNINLLPDNTVMSLLNSVLEQKGVYFHAGEGEFVLVCPKRTKNDAEAREICQDIRNRLEFYFKSTASFGIANANAIGELRKATGKARRYTGMRFYLGPDIMVSETDSPGSIFGILPTDIIPESSLIEAVLSRDREKMMKLVDDILAVIRKVRPEPSVAISCLIEMNALIMSYARKAIEPGTALSLDMIKFFRACQTLDEMSEGMKEYVEALYDSLDGQWKQKLRGEITDAINYISEHYRENISLHDIALRFHMSTSRFCVVFKEGTGKTFVDYLNMVRIRKGEELLLHSKLTIYEIAYQVGFNSTTYFSKLFKRATSHFPSEYRRC